MNHSEVEELLGAYALDAVDGDEAAEIERHLHGCPRCRAELAGHREMAALLGNSGGDAPGEIWDRIAAQIAAGPELPHALPAPAIGRAEVVSIETAGRARSQRGDRGARYDAGRRPPGWLAVALGAAAAALVAVVAVLGVQISHLDGQVHGLQNALPGLTKGAVTAEALAAESGPHQSVTLASSSASFHAEAVIAPDNVAFVVSSDLADLSSGQTYQVWALVNGKPVSLGVAGSAAPSASNVWVFRVQTHMTMIMVNVEPEGGVPAPTTPVLVQSPVHIV
jgi:anti-sigma factor RsiW